MSTTVASDRLAGTWSLNPVHSSVEFAVKYLVGSYRARFDEVEAHLADGQLTGKAKVASVSAKDEMLAGHLQSPDFFDAERYPDLTFDSASLAVDGDQVTLEGELTVKGVTRPLTATGTIAGPAQHPAGHTVLGLTLDTTIDRTDFGIEWNLDLPTGGKALSNEVELHVVLEFIEA